MKNKILILLLASVALTACFNQNQDGCPADMYLTFDVDDSYEPSTYDARIANDVMLYIFKDERVVSGTLIPYDKISGKKDYVIRKDADHSGHLDIVAWAVPAGQNPSCIPQLSIGDDLSDIYRTLQPTRTDDCCATTLDLQVKRKQSTEAVDEETRHNLGLNYSDCRMEVRITDNDNVLSQPGSNPEVCVYGTMTSMDMDMKGVGNAAAVHSDLNCPSDDAVNFTTGRFGVLPSANGQVVSVNIGDGTKMVATLTVPTSALPQGAVSGGLIIFEYTLNQPEFTIIIDGFRQNIVITDM